MMLNAEQRRDGLARLAASLGYGQEMLRWGFPAWVDDRIAHADMVAFGAAAPQPQDQTTAALAGFDMLAGHRLDDTLAICRALAAPTAALARDGEIELWSVGAREKRERLHSFPYEELDQLPEGLADALGPRSVLSAKRSFFHQQALFRSDVSELLSEARSDSESRLITVVEAEALRLIGSRAPSSRAADQAQIARVSRLLVGAMATLMVTDKLALKPERGPADVSLAYARERFPDYFAWTGALVEAEHEELLTTIESLGREVSYAGLDPAVAATVYESAILDSASRRKFGIYYTPPELAAKVMAAVPVEEIDPAERRVLDPTCGSGTFLLAAYDRLRDVAPIDMDMFAAHKDTTSRLTGFDIDPLAVEVARLALLLNALPAGNGWKVTRADALESHVNVKASIVVSNPPWDDIRSEHGKRQQLADRFVRRMLEMVAPGGYLATVLPAGWLSSGTSARLRVELEKQCSLIEVWRLPQDTFARPDVEAAVVIAQRDRAPGSYVFRRSFRKDEWKQRFFKRDGLADETFLSAPTRRLRPGVWLHGPLDEHYELLAQLPTLKSIAKVSKGPVPTPPVRERGGSGEGRWLPVLKGTEAYTPVPESLLRRVRYPDEFNWRKGDGSEYLQPKAMVSSVRNPDIPWRLKVIPDVDGGIIPRESVFAVVPYEASPESVHALCALLGSSVANCWVDTLSPLSIPKALLEAMPVPPAGLIWRELAEAGQELIRRATDGGLTSEHLVSVDRLVTLAYGLDADAFTRLGAHFAGIPAPERGIRYPALVVKSQEQTVPGRSRTFGTVLDIRDGQLRLWVSGITGEDGEWLSLPRGFPGAQLHPGATFEVTVIGKDLDEGRFKFQSEGHLGFEDFLLAGAGGGT
jgi:predicted RNA methylase